MNPIVRKSIMAVGIVTSLAAIGYGIYLFYKRQIALALQYCYKISNIKIYHVRKDSISFELFVKIQNKSDFSLTINSYDLNIILNDRQIARIKSEKFYKITPSGISEISLAVDFDPSKVFDKDYLASLLSYMVVDQSKIVLKIKGTLNVSMDFIRLKDFDFEYSTTMSKIVNAKPAENVKCDIV
jgi:LEA14-like dessication related protein